VIGKPLRGGLPYPSSPERLPHERKGPGRDLRQEADRPPAASADQFIDANPILLDATIMMTHYSAGLLFPAEARARFVEPDLQAIPRHDA
jgi:hypothetical protein